LNTLTCAPILGKRVNKYLQRSYPDSDRYGTNVWQVPPTFIPRFWPVWN